MLIFILDTMKNAYYFLLMFSGAGILTSVILTGGL